MMKRKYALVLALVLVFLNAWKWWPEGGNGVGSESEATEKLGYVDLELPDTIYEIDVTGVTKRDVFNYKKNEAKSLLLKKASVTESGGKDLIKRRKKTTSIVNEKPKTGTLRLAGVLIKDENRHAFIMSGDKKSSLSEGDVFDGAYKVSTINEFSVTIYNLKTKSIIELKL